MIAHGVLSHERGRNTVLKPKILAFMQLPPPIHGVTTTNLMISKSHYIRARFNVSILPLKFSNSIEEIGQINLGKIIQSIRLAVKLLVVITRIRPNLIYFTLSPVGNAFYRDLIFVAIIKFFGFRHVFHLHGKGIKVASKQMINRWIYTWVFREARIILLSDHLYPDIERFVKRENCYYLQNGIANQESKKHRNRIDTPKGLVHLVFMSNMVVTKGPIVFLKALVHLKKRGVNFKASFAGQWFSDGCADQFEAIMKEEVMFSLVRYIGPKYGDEKAVLMGGADIFIHPTFNDCFPLVILEAMSYGLPVVSTPEGAISDMVQDGVTGFLVPQKDAKALADRLEQLINNEELRIQLGKAGRKRFLENFTQDKFEKNLCRILEEYLSDSKS